MACSIAFEDLATVVFVWVADGYQFMECVGFRAR